MNDGGERPPGVELRCTERSVIARHVPTDVSCHAASVSDAITWLAEAVALQTGADGAVDDPEEFLARASSQAEHD